MQYTNINIFTFSYKELSFFFLFFFWWTYNGLSWSISLMQSSNPLGRQIFLLLCCVGEILLHSLILLSKQVENWGLKWRGMERGRGQIISLHFKEKKKDNQAQHHHLKVSQKLHGHHFSSTLEIFLFFKLNSKLYLRLKTLVSL